MKKFDRMEIKHFYETYVDTANLQCFLEIICGEYTKDITPEEAEVIWYTIDLTIEYTFP